MDAQNELDLRKFVVPEFVFGTGACQLVGRYARNLGARKVLVVSDPGVIQAGWTAQVIESLKHEDLPHILFSQVTSNPRGSEVMAGVQVYQREGCNLIVAVGGGSPIDCAKGIGIASANRRDIFECEGVDRVPIPGPRLIYIPTMASSSADVSQFEIITHLECRVKSAIISKTVVPDVALIDPVTLITMDALVHAVEALVSNAILLEYVISYNLESAFDRYLRVGQAMGLDPKRGEEKETILGAIKHFREAIDIGQTLGQIGLKRNDIPQLARKAMQDVCIVIQPRRPTQRDIEVIYEKAL